MQQPRRPPMTSDQIRKESLEQEADHVLQETRMVLPGIQALFGFQLIAVFNQRFDTALLPSEQRLHLAAIVLVAAAVALIMTPAAYHRQVERDTISRRFVDLASRLLAWAMVPLLVAIVLDSYVVAQVVLAHRAASGLVAAALLALFGWLWFGLPWVARRGRQPAG